MQLQSGVGGLRVRSSGCVFTAWDCLGCAVRFRLGCKDLLITTGWADGTVLLIMCLWIRLSTNGCFFFKGNMTGRARARARGRPPSQEAAIPPVGAASVSWFSFNWHSCALRCYCCSLLYYVCFKWNSYIGWHSYHVEWVHLPLWSWVSEVFPKEVVERRELNSRWSLLSLALDWYRGIVIPQSWFCSWFLSERISEVKGDQRSLYITFW